MPRAVLFVVFLTIATAVVVGWHYYLWARLVRDVRPADRWRKAGKVLFVVLAVAFPAAMIAGRSLPVDALRPAFMVGFGWLGTSFMLVMMLFVTDLGKLGAWGVRRVAGGRPVSPERRLTLARIIAGAVALTGFTSTASGAVSALGAIPVERVRIPLRRLSAKMSGTRVVQLTDLHIGPTLKRPWVEGVVAQVQTIHPDVIVITGDLVDGSVEALREHVAPLGKLKAEYGVYFVTGNHEYYSGADAWIAEVERLGIRVLRNEHVAIGEGDDAFYLAGVDDWEAARHGIGHGHDVAAAVRGMDAGREVVLLAHQPRSIRDAVRHGVGLQLSGHTHGGQIYPWYHFVFLQQPYVSGLHQIDDTLLYVSRGTGFWGPPLRVGAPPEISLIELVRA